MGNRPWVIFDYDDTLGGVLINGEVRNNEVAYLDAQAQFETYMASLGFSLEQAKQIRKATDEHLCREFGFSWRGRYAESMLRTYKALASKHGKEVDGEVLAKVDQIGNSVFTHRYMPLPGALRTMQALKHDYSIAVVTKGENQEQRKKIHDSGVWAFTDSIHVVGFKNTEEWDTVLKALGLETTDQRLTSWAVGNSPKSDVNVPARLGLNAIHVDQGGWTFEKEPYAEPINGAQLHTVAKIHEILEIIPWR